MKIEKVNENQIRCTLTREDLAERQIKLSELAYGTEKAKSLFRDMMQQAAYEFGFEAEDIPLMIEAIPLSADTIILIVTKVEYPEELDTRFSQFTDPDPEDVEDAEESAISVAAAAGADDILGMFRRMENTDVEDDFTSAEGEEKQNEENLVSVPTDITKLFVFRDLSELMRLAHILKDFYTGSNDLYQNQATHKYYLLASKSSQSPEEFNKVCNILSEYAQQQGYSVGVGAFFREHYRLILKGDAIQKLGIL